MKLSRNADLFWGAVIFIFLCVLPMLNNCGML